MSRPHSSAAPLVAMLLTGLTLASHAQDCPSGGLALEARATLPLPVTFGIEGVAAGANGALALWSAEGEVLAITTPGVLERRKLPDPIRPAGVALTPAGYRILDRQTGRDYLLGEDSVPIVLDRVTLPTTETLDQAVWQDGQWLLGLRDGASREFHVRRGDTLVYRSIAGPTLKAIPRYHLSPAGPGLLLTGVTAPFELIRLTADGRADTLAGALPMAAAALIPMDSLPLWRALPAVAIECGVLVTLSDLTGDRRLLLRYSESGRLEKVTLLDAPLGLMARLTGANAVLAARRAGTLELVWYDWRWIREPQ